MKYPKLAQRALEALTEAHDMMDWEHDCHAASCHLVEYGVANRVARGTCRGVGSQHSWAILGQNPYRPDLIIDPTLWSYREDVKGIWIGQPKQFGHTPHGAGSIMMWGKPVRGPGPAIRLNQVGLSPEARTFLKRLGPLDAMGWSTLFKAPVQDWPAQEIVQRAYQSAKLRAYIPLDRVGMLLADPRSELWPINHKVQEMA